MKLDNQQMRQLWLHSHGLLTAPGTGKPDVMAIIRQLGFVQLDSIQNLSRAHHHILWSRHHGYKEHMVDDLLASRQHIFEHFTHDASILPMETWPLWQRRINRLAAWYAASSWHNQDHVDEWQDMLIDRIRQDGPLSSRDFDSIRTGNKKTWSRPPHKQVLDFLWYKGVLSTSHRQNFHKFYDLSERVIPPEFRNQVIPEQVQINALCHAALERLVVASPQDIRKFWEATDVAEVKTWLANNRDQVMPVTWTDHQGMEHTTVALSSLPDRLDDLPSPSGQMRIVNPFDPVVRDRVRLKALFGFDYKIEIFVPAAKRQYGYYVYPLLEGDRFVGRLEAKGDRKTGKLTVINLWPEPGITWGKGRQKKLETALNKLAKLAGLQTIDGL